MVTKSVVKYVHSLSVKKYRDIEQCFVAEGPKVVTDLLPLMPCRILFATEAYFHTVDSGLLKAVEQVEIVSQAELERLSLLRSPRDAVAVFRRFSDALPADVQRFPATSLCLALDDVQDPGNLGTILRVADWFGIEHVFASPGTADVYAPKVVQATMGAVGRVRIHYLDLTTFLQSLQTEIPVYGTFLDGKTIYDQPLSENGIIIMGNEGKGISESVKKYVRNRLFIPNYPEGRNTSESLNVAIATAIVCAEFRRR